MKPIAVFYHCLYKVGDPPEPLPIAVGIIGEQIALLRQSGLLDASSQIVCGINGGEESKPIAEVLLPQKANIVFHGLQCRNECRTIRVLEEWLPGHEDWYVFYHHSKGATHATRDARCVHWRDCMERQLVQNWKRCVQDLDAGYDAVGCHWFTPPFTPKGQYIFAGNFFWAKASYLLTLPSILLRDRIRISGIDSLESRYESEVWIGNGPVRPRIKDYHKNWTVDAKKHP